MILSDFDMNLPFGAYNKSLDVQTEYLKNMLISTEYLWNILKQIKLIQLPNWYLGAGSIAQTYWNYQHGFLPNNYIKDIDIAYFDKSDLSEESEQLHEIKIRNLFLDMSVKFDVKNQARVHLWYEKKFDFAIKQYSSTEQAISTWPTTSTCIGVKYENNNLSIYAPYGLNDLFGMVVRPNKTLITKDIYQVKVKRWLECWPLLKIISWDNA